MHPFQPLRFRLVTAAIAIGMLTAAAGAGLVDMRFSRTSASAGLCQIIEIDLVVSSNDASPQPFDALDAILSWDPDKLNLLGVDDSNAGATFFLTGFLTDPDGVNLDLDDGEVIFTALATPGSPVNAPAGPDALIVTTFVFQAVEETPSTDVDYLLTTGVFGQTRILLVGNLITGDTSSIASVTVGACPGDTDYNGVVNIVDLLALLAAWGPCSGCCPEDIDNSLTVNIIDLLALLAAWGPCD